MNNLRNHVLSTALAKPWGLNFKNILDCLDYLGQQLWQVEQRAQLSRDTKNKIDSSIAGLNDITKDSVQSLQLTASSLEDIWLFLMSRLQNGNAASVMLMSVADETHDCIRTPFIAVGPSTLSAHHERCTSLACTEKHLVQAYFAQDTMFCDSLSQLGQLKLPEKHASYAEKQMSIFTVPLVGGNKTVALLTLAFDEIDSLSQSRLSYLYSIKNVLAQLIWNIVLNDRLKQNDKIDNLTGLMNHTYCQTLLMYELKKANQYCHTLTVMLFDINNLSLINQTLGHLKGDEAICYLANVVKRSSRGIDTVARYGNDEILLILPEMDTKQAEHLGKTILHQLKHELPEHLQNISISLSHATYPDDAKNQEQLLKKAEQALSLAKYRKSNQFVQLPSHQTHQEEDSVLIEVFASQVAKKYDRIHLPSIYQRLTRLGQTPQENLILQPSDLTLETITSLAGALEAKDRYTRGHSQAVSNYAAVLAHALNMTDAEVEEIRGAAFLHDIGKIGIPEYILGKQGPLNEKEWEIMKQHPVIGAQQILYPLKSLRALVPAVECHHENWDGSGHPYGYKGEKIPIGARIISIVDVFHALTSDRSYRKAMSVAEAQAIMKKGAGQKWDAKLLDVFFTMLTKANSTL